MTKKQTDSELGLFLPQPTFGNSSASLVPYEPSTPATKEEARFNRAITAHERAERGYKEKAAFGIALLKELNVTATHIFVEELHEYGLLKQSLQGEEFQGMGEEFIRITAQRSGQHNLALIELAASNIGAESHRSLYFEPEEPTRLERLTGSWKK